MTNPKKQFIEKAAPEYWYSYAAELADTANEIYRRSKDQWIGYIHRESDGSTRTERRPFVSRPVLLLCGFSLENLLKGLLVSERPFLLEGGKLSKELLSHDLVKLAGRLISVQLSKVEEELLSLLSDVVPYYGRYPVPRHAQEVKPEKYISDDVFSIFTALFERLEMQLYRLNFQGIDAPEGVRFPNLRLTHLDTKADFISGPSEMDWKDFLREFKSAEGNEPSH